MRHLATTDHDYCHTTAAFRVEGKYGSYAIGLIAEGRSGRKTHGGPLVPGPWGWVSARASVIDATGQAYNELMACPVIALGERFTVAGLPGVWALAYEKPNTYSHPEMTLVQVSDPSDEPQRKDNA